MQDKFFTSNKYEIGKTGVINTHNGQIQTPAFTFCATKAAIKGLFPWQMKDCLTQLILVNTFHLFTMTKIIEDLGGIHKFLGWNGPIISDSGGYQIFSYGHGSVSAEIKGTKTRLKPLTNIKETGCYFNITKEEVQKGIQSSQSLFMSAETSMKAQIELGVDIIMSFDECTPYHVDYGYTKRSMLRSHRWEKRSLDYFKKHKKDHQFLYGIIQGGIYKDLRQSSIDFVCSEDFDGIAIGGCLGKDKEQMYDIVDFCAKQLPNKPVHLLGIGDIDDIITMAPYIDTFDCVQPTRLGRHGIVLRPKGRLNLRNSSCSKMNEPIHKDCKCLVCEKFSVAYLHHCIKSHEIIGYCAAVYHNVYTMNKLMSDIREGISNNKMWQVRSYWI